MAQCGKCGKKGLFLKLNSEGMCKACSELLEHQKKLDELQAEQQKVENAIKNKRKDLKELETNRQKTYDTIKRQAESAAIANIKDELEKTQKKLTAKTSDLSEVTDKLQKVKSDFDKENKKYIKVKTAYESYQAANKNYLKNGETKLDESFLKSLSPAVEVDLQCMNVKQLRSLYTQNKTLIKNCLERYEGRYTTKSNAAIYRLMVIALEAELQNILYSIRYGKLDESIQSVKDITQKYMAIASDGNQTIVPTLKKFIAEIEHLFIEAVKIEYEYYVQRERIKEEQRAIREQMRQEAEERKALEQEKKRIAAEEQKFTNEIENIRSQLAEATESKSAKLMARIRELEAQLEKISDKREQIASLENGKAGHVYIISNIGSFGENVYKIGMTRRLDPMERVYELGNASVPFPFDVHGMIFSDDAVGLERDLHTMFSDNRLNKVNLRKEFFNVSLDKIKTVVEKRFPTAEFRITALAEQYRQSLELNKSLMELSEEDVALAVD